MKVRHRWPLEALTVLLLSCAAWAATGQTDTGSPLDAAWEDREVFRPGLVTSQQNVLDDLPGATVYHIDMEFIPENLLLRGIQEVKYTNRETQTLSEIYVRLYPNAAGGRSTLDKTLRDGQPVLAEATYDETILRLPMDPELAPGESTILHWTFEIEMATEYLGWGPFGAIDGILSLDQFIPVIPVYDETGWNVAPVPPRGDWSYFDASFYLVKVTAPSDLVLAAGGVEVSGVDNGQTQSRTYAAGPVRDFYLAGSTSYEVVSITHGEVTINHYVLPEGVSHARLGLTVAADALDVFGSRFGSYPYTELDFAATIVPGGSAMEYPGIVAMSRETYRPGAILWGSLRSEEAMEIIIIHEMAHQWFYNIVGNDQVDEPWLDEALAQYATNLYFEDVYGPLRAEQYRREWTSRWNAIGRRDIPIGLSTFEFDVPTYGSIIYGRGPLFVQELGLVLDLDSFLPAYVEAHRWGIATTRSFARLASEMTETDLTALFDAWVYR